MGWDTLLVSLLDSVSPESVLSHFLHSLCTAEGQVTLAHPRAYGFIFQLIPAANTLRRHAGQGEASSLPQPLIWVLSPSCPCRLFLETLLPNHYGTLSPCCVPRVRRPGDPSSWCLFSSFVLLTTDVFLGIINDQRCGPLLNIPDFLVQCSRLLNVHKYSPIGKRENNWLKGKDILQKMGGIGTRQKVRFEPRIWRVYLALGMEKRKLLHIKGKNIIFLQL